MKGGISKCAGMVIYDSDHEGDNGVLCYYEGEEPKWKIGEHKQLMEELDEMSKPYEQDGYLGWFVWLEILAMIIATILVWKNTHHLFTTLGVAAFCIAGFMPIITFVSVLLTKHEYKERKYFHQFRKYHACEHMILNYNDRKEKNWTVEEFSKMSKFHNECGSVHSFANLIFAILLGVFIAKIPELGFFKAVIFAALSKVLLFINMLNPYNPLKLIQFFIVEKPTEKEMNLVIEGMKQLNAQFQKTGE